MQRTGRHLLLLAIVSAIEVAACSSTNTNTSAVGPVATNYAISVTVSGLASTGLILQDNGGDNLPISANGSFLFDTTHPQWRQL